MKFSFQSVKLASSSLLYIVLKLFFFSNDVISGVAYVTLHLMTSLVSASLSWNKKVHDRLIHLIGALYSIRSVKKATEQN